MTTKTIDFASEYTCFPGGRYRQDGPYSGEEFRERFLEPFFESSDRIIVDINRVIGIPYSFIDEAFGKLASKFGADIVRAKLEIESSHNPRAKRSIDDAIAESGTKVAA